MANNLSANTKNVLLVIDGLELIRTIRKMKSDLPILVLSGMQSKEVYLDAAKVMGQTLFCQNQLIGISYCTPLGIYWEYLTSNKNPWTKK